MTAVNLPFNFSSISQSFQLGSSLKEKPSSEGYWAIIRGDSVVVREEAESCFLPQGAAPVWLNSYQPPICIGFWNDIPLWACTIPSDTPLEAPYTAEPFNAGEQRLDMATLTLAGLSQQILHWHRHSRFCSRCGSPTEPLNHNWGTRCISCTAEHYPHIHPCAIVLVKRGSQILLTRKPGWKSGRYGLVAGFLDFGESLEECAIREVKEETGIEICNVRYVGSQNWPFPAQLMAGFVADYAGGEIIVDRDELEDAKWFSIDALPSLPPVRSIARFIIDNFAR
ncbi:NAD(+) diphosphatase [Geobacter chapellei]|uniref:NAD(+) diphosphatase n=2 Tax=Pelotalea chapellei TaxID=44671 RepID=A0ABS5UBJ9_9BACT|nr:NAD(+) diphosphatase [Pelotalea chapellei]